MSGRPGPDRPTRVAIDVSGTAAEVLVAGAVQVTAGRSDVDVLLVGRPDALDPALLAASPRADRLEVVPARDVIAASDDPVRAVRARRGASVRVATRLLRDEQVDAVVSFGPPAAALAAAQFSLGRLPGMTTACFASELTVRTPSPAVLVDSGAGPGASPETLVQYAYAGVAYAQAQWQLTEPVVGLLAAGFPAGSGDVQHDEADRRLAGLGLNYAGPVPVTELLDGSRRVDVIVTDGFTGAVLLAALAAPERERVLLGVGGVVVTAPATDPEAVVAGIGRAVEAVERRVVPTLAASMSQLIALRRGQPT